MMQLASKHTQQASLAVFMRAHLIDKMPEELSQEGLRGHKGVLELQGREPQGDIGDVDEVNAQGCGQPVTVGIGPNIHLMEARPWDEAEVAAHSPQIQLLKVPLATKARFALAGHRCSGIQQLLQGNILQLSSALGQSDRRLPGFATSLSAIVSRKTLQSVHCWPLLTLLGHGCSRQQTHLSKFSTPGFLQYHVATGQYHGL